LEKAHRLKPVLLKSKNASKVLALRQAGIFQPSL
jgi:hypothetical protein